MRHYTRSVFTPLIITAAAIVLGGIAVMATAPGGADNGTHKGDQTFVSGAGKLDQCNGGMSGGQSKYFATDTYPFFPRCLLGTEITHI